MSGIGTTSNLGQNLNWILENRLRKDVSPIGAKNCVNLTYTLPNSDIAAPGTLEVFLSGLKLEPVDFTVSVDGTGFTLILDPDDWNRLNCPPQYEEPLRVNYLSLGNNC